MVDDPSRYPNRVTVGPLGECIPGACGSQRPPRQGRGLRENACGVIVLTRPVLCACGRLLTANVAGGFAGGEVGVKQFVEKGDVKLRKPGQPGPKQFSPLTLAGYVALAGAVGGVVLGYLNNGEPAFTESGLQVRAPGRRAMGRSCSACCMRKCAAQAPGVCGSALLRRGTLALLNPVSPALRMVLCVRPPCRRQLMRLHGSQFQHSALSARAR